MLEKFSPECFRKLFIFLKNTRTYQKFEKTPNIFKKSDKFDWNWSSRVIRDMELTNIPGLKFLTYVF